MLMIIIDWLYILFTTFCMGYAFLRLVQRLFSYRTKHVDSVLMTGLVCATVYAQVFSFFTGVSLLANVVLFVFSVCVVLFWHRQIWQFLQEVWARNGKLIKILVPILFLAWAYFTSRGYMVPDTQQYHAQSIRWIEEYGIVKGQGILTGNARICSLRHIIGIRGQKENGNGNISGQFCHHQGVPGGGGAGKEDYVRGLWQSLQPA